MLVCECDFILLGFYKKIIHQIILKKTSIRTLELNWQILILAFCWKDDFIDCFSDESVTGKAGTDIQEGKCSWLAVTALQRCNQAQRSLFEEHYGSKDPLDIDRIKLLYDELELPRLYREQEQARYDEIVSRAHALSRDTALSPKLFLKLIDMIHNRKQ